jgi:hypothetical protein
VWWPGLRNSPTVTHACRKRRLKWVPSAWGYSWDTLSPGVINTETWFSRSSPVKGLLLRNPNRRGQGPYWAVEPYVDDDDDEVAKLRYLGTAVTTQCLFYRLLPKNLKIDIPDTIMLYVVLYGCESQSRTF